MLSALVSGLIHADQLIILTDVNGLYDANPHNKPRCKAINRIEEITDEMLGFASGSGSKVGTGGMQSKLLAAKYCNESWCKSVYRKWKGDDKLLTF